MLRLKVGTVYRVHANAPYHAGCLVQVESLGLEPEERGWTKGKGESWAFARKVGDYDSTQWFYESELEEASAIDQLAAVTIEECEE